jgi:hypothetical protein
MPRNERALHLDTFERPAKKGLSRLLRRHSRNRVLGTRGRGELPQDEGAGSSLLKAPEDEESSPGRAQNMLGRARMPLRKILRVTEERDRE